MNANTYQPIAPRPAPVNTEGASAWIRTNLLGNWSTTLSTFIIGGLLLWYLPQLLNWALFQASWRPDAEACRANSAGACWGVIAEKYRLIVSRDARKM